MIDFTLLWIWLSIAGITFLLVYIGLYAARWEKSDETVVETAEKPTDETAVETVQETKPKRTPMQWVLRVLLFVLGIYAWLLLCVASFFFVLFLIIAGPLAVLILFMICLIRYIRIKRKQKRCPEEVSPEEVKFRKTCMIVYAVMLVVVLAVVFCLLFIPSCDIAYM